MKKVSTLMIVLVILLDALLASACGVTAAEVNARRPMATVEVSTPSLTPTQTLVPPSATPSRMEIPIQNANLVIQVMDIEKPYQVYLGDNLIFTPGDGNLFLGLGIKMTNLTDSDIPFKWRDIYLINKYQHKWYPLWGAYKKTNAIIDPLGIALRQFKVDPKNQPDAHIYLGENGYLRAIFRLPRDNYYYYLSLADLPLIEINYADY